MNFIGNRSFYHRLFCALLPAFVLLELYRSFFQGRFSLLGFAWEEILLLLWVGILFGAGVFFSFREKRKRLLLFVFSYLALFFVYAVFHGLNTARFPSHLLPGASPNFFRELYYLFRLYLAPVCLIFSAKMLSLPSEKLLFAFKLLGFSVSLGVLIPCLLGFSFSSYEEGNQIIKGSFFSWFSLKEDSSFAAYTARGLFPRANVIGAVLFGCTPIGAFLSIRKGGFSNHFLLFCLGFASVCVGTKVASFGFFLALFAALSAKLFEFVWRKEKKSALNALFLPALIGFILLPLFFVSPGFRLQMQREEEKITAIRPITYVHQIEHLFEKEDLSQEDLTLLSCYVDEHGWDHFIDPWFPSLYPVKGDGEFWLRVLERDGRENQNARKFKAELCQRILTRSARPADRFLGLGFTSGIPYIERDFVHQYYQFGILGVLILLLPFFVKLISLVARLFRSLRKKTPLFFSFCLVLSFVDFLGAAYFAGHVFDTLFSTYSLSALCSLEDEKKENV